MAFAQSVLKLSENKKQAYTKVLLYVSINYDYDNVDDDIITMMMIMIMIGSFADERNQKR